MQEPQFNKMTNLVFCNSATTEGAGLYYDVLGTFDRRELYLKWKILNLNYYEFLYFRSKYFYEALPNTINLCSNVKTRVNSAKVHTSLKACVTS